MNILLIFTGFIVAFIIVFCYEHKIRNLSVKPKNKVHFYVARDKEGILWLYMGKLNRNERISISCKRRGRKCIGYGNDLKMYGLNKNDYKDLKWEDGPIEVFLNMED